MVHRTPFAAAAAAAPLALDQSLRQHSHHFWLVVSIFVSQPQHMRRPDLARHILLMLASCCLIQFLLASLMLLQRPQTLVLGLAHRSNSRAQGYHLYITRGCYSAGLVTDKNWGFAMQVKHSGAVLYILLQAKCNGSAPAEDVGPTETGPVFHTLEVRGAVQVMLTRRNCAWERRNLTLLSLALIAAMTTHALWAKTSRIW